MLTVQIRGRVGFVFGKIIRYAVTFSVILLMNFIIPRVMPGDPMVNLLGEEAMHVDPQIIDALRKEYKLDHPVHLQFSHYIQNLACLDLGYSIHKHLSVTNLLAQRLPWTLALVLPSVLIGAILSLMMGTICGFKYGSIVDRLITGLAIWIFAIPSFLIAMIMVSIFGYHLEWFPIGNLASGLKHGLEWWIDVIWHLCLPIFILSVIDLAHGLIIMRSAIVKILDEYFILIAKAKGLSSSVIGIHYVMKNALPQFISITALNFGFMVSGALVIEIIFSLNGMGTTILDAVMSRDYPVIQGAFLVITIVVLSANLFAELLYGIADPRIADGHQESMAG